MIIITVRCSLVKTGTCAFHPLTPRVPCPKIVRAMYACEERSTSTSEQHPTERRSTFCVVICLMRKGSQREGKERMIRHKATNREVMDDNEMNIRTDEKPTNHERGQEGTKVNPS